MTSELKYKTEVTSSVMKRRVRKGMSFSVQYRKRDKIKYKITDGNDE